MSQRTFCVGLWGAGALCYGVAAAVLLQFWLFSEEGSGSNFQPLKGTSSGPTDSPTYDKLQLIDSDPFWTAQLQRPLVDAPPPTITPVKTQPIQTARKMGFKLLGTAVESSRKTAIFQLTGGLIQVRTVGEEVGKSHNTAIVRSIKEGTVVVEYAKKLVTLSVQSKK